MPVPGRYRSLASNLSLVAVLACAALAVARLGFGPFDAKLLGVRVTALAVWPPLVWLAATVAIHVAVNTLGGGAARAALRALTARTAALVAFLRPNWAVAAIALVTVGVGVYWGTEAAGG